MSIIDRIVRLCKADIHGLMDALEDKRLLLKQSLREMEEETEHEQRRYGHLLATRRRLAAEADRTRSGLDKLEGELDLAVASGHDELCRSLIKKRIGQLELYDARGSAMAELDAAIAAARDKLEHQRLACDQLKLQADEYLRRSASYAQDMDAYPQHEEHSRSATLDPAVELELLQRKQAYTQRAPQSAAA